MYGTPWGDARNGIDPRDGEDDDMGLSESRKRQGWGRPAWGTATVMTGDWPSVSADPGSPGSEAADSVSVESDAAAGPLYI